MSLYDDKKEKVRLAVIRGCNKRIEDNFHELNMWLSFEDWEFPHIYETEFDKEFSQYISQDRDTSSVILSHAKNLAYFVATITSVTKDKKKIKKLVDEFITEQFEDFENVCDYISMTMYHENNPDTDETTARTVQNLPTDDNPN